MRSTENNCLHDPHLQAYYNRKDSLQRLKSKGFITSSGKVGLGVALTSTGLLWQRPMGRDLTRLSADSCTLASRTLCSATGLGQSV